MEELGLQWKPTAHTYKSDGKYNNAAGSNRIATLDHVYFRKGNRLTISANVNILEDATTDHSPLLLTIGRQPAKLQSTRVTRTTRDWTKINKDELNLFLLGWNWDSYFNMTNVDDLAESLRMAISDAIDHVATPRAYIPQTSMSVYNLIHGRR
ncbi:Hypothetical protein FKW44_007532 [Caligus rogercresseyi]|uniref:Uncharacterized protein n=1 Tax=Caligus rogercresseyi TaxID=217165 RepID=A0A7T8KEW5_CALRO|nr:Hypothetical protein FKW44_007532 [Caligus rogercresseyi]